MISYETNYLAHHGVKGMKWGHRKQIVRKGRKKSSKKEKWSTKKKVAVAGAIVGGAALAAIGGYTIYKLKQNKKSAIINTGQNFIEGFKYNSFDYDRFDYNRFSPVTNYSGKSVSTYANGARKVRFSNGSNLSRNYVNRTPVNRVQISRVPIDRIPIDRIKVG